MNNISNRIGSAFTSIHTLNKADKLQSQQDQQIDLSYNDSSEDQVEISERARFLSKIASMPDIRQEKVDQVKQQLTDGTYDINGKLSVAFDRLFAEEAGF